VTNVILQARWNTREGLRYDVKKALNRGVDDDESMDEDDSEDEDAIDQREKEELQKAIERAERAAQRQADR
jgi:hypothetical protein